MRIPVFGASAAISVPPPSSLEAPHKKALNPPHAAVPNKFLHDKYMSLPPACQVNTVCMILSGKDGGQSVRIPRVSARDVFGIRG
jgi:hypothetical protein